MREIVQQSGWEFDILSGETFTSLKHVYTFCTLAAVKQKSINPRSKKKNEI